MASAVAGHRAWHSFSLPASRIHFRVRTCTLGILDSGLDVGLVLACKLICNLTNENLTFCAANKSQQTK